MPAHTLVFSLALATGLPLALAPGERADATAHFEAAAELYAREDYAGAAREFAIAYALDPRVDTLFAWAQAERLAGHGEQALELYERLLAGELSASQREAIVGLRDEVRDELARTGGEPSEPDVPSEPDPPTRDRVGLATTSVGAGLTLLGGGLLVGAALADRRVRRAQTYPEFADAFDPQTGRGRGAVALYASGGVLAAAGLASLLVGVIRLAQGKPRAARRVAMLPALGRDHVGFVLTIGSWR